MPPLQPRIADLALPSADFGPVDFSHGFQRRINCALKARYARWVLPASASAAAAVHAARFETVAAGRGGGGGGQVHGCVRQLELSDTIMVN
jgi:hypothetical protein